VNGHYKTASQPRGASERDLYGPTEMRHARQIESETTVRVRAAIDVVAAAWRVEAVLALAARPRRFTDLRAHLTGVSAKMLSQTLRDLERRCVIAHTGERVYELTPQGVALAGGLLEIVGWDADGCGAGDHDDWHTPATD
jgi:DNA-binding HxlR family transcriptional regulator